MRRGWTLLIPSGPGDKRHLFVVINDPGEDEEVVLASLSSVHARSDTACPVRPGDHPFVHHESCIEYRYCRTDSVAHLNTLLKSGYITRHEDASDELVQRIVDGAWASEHTRPRGHEFSSYSTDQRFRCRKSHTPLILWCRWADSNRRPTDYEKTLRHPYLVLSHRSFTPPTIFQALRFNGLGLSRPVVVLSGPHLYVVALVTRW